MAITAIKRDFSDIPNIVRTTSSNTLSEVAASGYLTEQESNINDINSGTWTWYASDLVEMYASDGLGLFTLNADLDTLVTYGGSGSGITPQEIQDQTFTFDATDSGIADGYVTDLTPAITSYVDGLSFTFIPANNNMTTTPTLDAGAGVINLIGPGGGALSANDILANVPATVKYFSSNFYLQNPATSGGGLTATEVQKNITNIAGDEAAVPDAYVATLTPPITNFGDAQIGMPITLLVNNSNLTSSPTLDAGFGPLSISRADGLTMQPGDISTSSPAELIFYGAWVLLNPRTATNIVYNMTPFLYMPTVTTNNPFTYTSATLMNVQFPGAGYALGGFVHSSGSKSIDFTTVGAGGLDSGTVTADTLYYIFAISNIGDSTSNVIAGTSYTNPVMPMGYTTYASYGIVATNGAGALYPFVCTQTSAYTSQMIFTPGISVLTGGTSTAAALPITPFDNLYSGIFKLKFAYTFTTATPGNSFFVSAYVAADDEITISSSVAAVPQKGVFEMSINSTSTGSGLLNYGVTNSGTDSLDLVLTGIEFINATDAGLI